MEEQFNFNDYPIGNHLEEISNSLKNSPNHCLILTAETGAGKSTVLPLWLLQQFKGSIIMTEPRRLAVLGVANRLSEELNQECGKTIGYKIHLENKISAETRMEIVTEGILVRNLQNDPALEKYNLVILDEFHERSVNTDLALAFIKEAMELRDDLFLIVMSATIDTKKLSDYLGNKTPVLKIPGRLFPVDVVYDEKSDVSKAVIKELDLTKKGNILAFLPGISDIRSCEEELLQELKNSDVELHILHSSVSLEQQKRALKENGRRKVILSSAIAETSLTVPGVTVVIDSGKSRVNRINISTGMENLVTEVESEFSAEQRKGRAGRLEAGKCVRLWNKFDLRKKDFEPEILRCDLTELVLECAERGIYNYDTIQWLDCPSKNAWKSAVDLLILFKFLKDDGHISEKGKAALNLGISPRLAAIVLDGKVNNFDYGPLFLKYSNYSDSSLEVQKKVLADLENRLKKIDFSLFKNLCEKYENPEFLILSGFLDRLAVKLSSQKNEKYEYQFYSGRKAILVKDNHRENKWICAPEVLSGESEAKIFDFEEIPEELILKYLENKTEVKQISYFENGKLEKSEKVLFGKIELKSKKIPVSKEDYKEAWINEIKEKGFAVLPMSEKTDRFITRVKFYFQQQNKVFDEKEISEKCDEWLAPFINDTILNPDNVYDALYWYLNGSEIDEKIPVVLKLTNGSKCKVSYSLQNSPVDKTKLVIRPVIEIIIQRIFGVFETPEIFGMKVLLKLLSPASRPLQITDDLKGFWNGAWIEICKEMKGRYPKHNWDYKQFKEPD